MGQGLAKGQGSGYTASQARMGKGVARESGSLRPTGRTGVSPAEAIPGP